MGVTRRVGGQLVTTKGTLVNSTMVVILLLLVLLVLCKVDGFHTFTMRPFNIPKWRTIDYFSPTERVSLSETPLAMSKSDSLQSTQPGKVRESVVPERNIIEELYIKKGRLPTKDVISICESAHQAFLQQDSLVEISLKITQNKDVIIIGDTHGQFSDFVNLLGLAEIMKEEDIQKKHVIVNGDFVDRGSQSMEIALVLFYLKQRYPENFTILRGNHESLQMSSRYGFQQEVYHKYTEDYEAIYNSFQKCFRTLPLAASVEMQEQGEKKKIMVCHGGIGRNTFKMSLEEIKQLNRFVEPFDDMTNVDTAAVTELLWSDPYYAAIETEDDEDPLSFYFPPNKSRGLPPGFMFTPKILQYFLNFNKLDYLVRSHQMKAHGYSISSDKKLVTVFSAPNYCESNNLAAFLLFEKGTTNMQLTQFNANTVE